ncbi:hypothetical protein GWN63_03240 [Candidatus Bathyarchaeota archaeon]|nr:hypothetical protein [Candidatus Bathyarchaeota archaeon]NIR17556.1 hypothetical protein [Desulfobacterales bacterium]NIU81244.1 hypothetical protein [Candidatus Bathyarchaeota archaeon]NIV67894.1 hypothetical protein [Candidatus Bathyarchaeota archaeon]NIW16338.1 hypothetical protein [Candidatus Bathyarchaeota archaeon]
MPRELQLDIRSAKGYIGRPVNLHLKDGSVIPYVIPVEARNKKPRLLRYRVPTKTTGANQVPLQSVSWVELLNPLLLSSGGD